LNICYPTFNYAVFGYVKIMKFLITGGCGFIGSNFIHRCFQTIKNIKITNIDSMGLGSNPKNLQQLKNRNYQFVRGNICNKKLLDKLTKDIDVIVNFAAESHVDRSIVDSTNFIKTNIIGVQNILEILRNRKNIKLIQISTDEVFGEILRGGFNETDRLSPSNPYAATKAAAEMLIKSYVRTYDVDVTLARCVNNYGPRQFPEKLVPKVIISALKNEKIPIHGKGTARRQWISVQDHCDALLKIILKSKKPSVYNISGSYEGSNIEVVEKILKIMGKSNNLIYFVKDRPGQDRRYAMSSKLLEKEIGFRNNVEFNQGLKSTVDWYMKNRDWWKNLPFKKITDPTPWSK